MPTRFSRRHGSLYLEEVRLSDLLQAGLQTPFFIYSQAQLLGNYAAYAEAAGISPGAVVAYAVKANHNPALLRLLAAQGAGAVVVSDMELHHALRHGFPPQRMLLHGNGKRPTDIDAALQAGTLISADSPFDLRHIDQAAGRRGTRAGVLLRVNPDIDPQVHPYISTGLRDSKFGIPESGFAELLTELRALPHIAVRGVHCHVGSTLRSVQPVADAARVTAALCQRLRADGHPIDTLDLGGGLDIDYRHTGEPIPTAAELVAALLPILRGLGVRLFLEPGRSLVGNAGALCGRVLGVKHNPARSFIVVDASMAQLIRPSLYDAYHHIELLEPAPGPAQPFDVVGPICESADFLGRDRLLPAPPEGSGVVIYDAGAYGFSMASRYNLHLLCAEYLVSGDTLRLVRRAETYDDFAGTFADQPISLREDTP